MWVKLNAFDYNKVLDTIVSEKGYEDSVSSLTMDDLFGIIQRVVALRRVREGKTVYREIGTILLNLAVAHYVETRDDDSEVNELVLIKGFFEAPFDPNWETGVYAEAVEVLARHYHTAPDGGLEIEPEEMMMIMEHICDYIYSEAESFDLADVLIEQQISSQLLEGDGVVHIEVYDVVGAIVSYRDHLITFPLIIAHVEVTG